MRKTRPQGRMVRKDVSRSHKIASLSDRAGFLFFMIVPHLSVYGKMNGSPHFVKGEVVPLIDRFTIETIQDCLKEISDKTNLKWFERDGMMWIQSLNWEEHQDLRTDRRGADEIPDYSGKVPGPIPPEVEVEVEGKVYIPPAAETASGDNGGKKRAKRKPVEYTPEFEKFWEEYPRPIHKEVAFNKFQVAIAEYSSGDIIRAAIGYTEKMKEEKREEKFMLLPATFLYAGRWKDYCFED